MKPSAFSDAVLFYADPDARPADLVYTFGGVDPVLEVAPGAMLTTWTRDCFGGAVRSSKDLVSVVCDPRMLNPQTGPFFITGAAPGDTIAIHFVAISPRESRGFSATVPFFGALTPTLLTPTLSSPLPEMTWVYELDLERRSVRYEALDSDFSVDLEMDPMHGTVGLAPGLGEVRSALAPGQWGGNMDTPEMRAGVTCYLGVNVEGALVSFGDGHARQGEGETCGVAVECSMDTVVIIDLLKHRGCAWPRLEDDEFIMVVGSSRPLEDAFRIAHSEIVLWVRELTGLSTMDAFQLVSQTALTPVANVVDTVYSVVAKVPKAVLGAVTPMGGMHTQMRRRRAVEGQLTIPAL